MYIFCFIFLGLSLPVMAENSTSQETAQLKAPQLKVEKPPMQKDALKDEPVESTHLCSPEEETKMPETFY